MNKRERELTVAIIMEHLSNMQIKRGNAIVYIKELKEDAIKQHNLVEKQELKNIKGSLTYIDRQLDTIKDYFSNIYYKRYLKKVEK